jgi:hypothetical protein
MIQSAITGEFFRIQTMTFDVGKFYLLWQVRNPAAHHIKDAGIWLEAIAV